MSLALRLVDQMWSKPSELGSFWTKPVVVHYRNGASPLGVCGSTSRDVHEFDDNSFYCKTDDTVYLSDDLMTSLFTQFRAIGVIGVVAHEMGHRADHLTHRDPSASINAENQADCDAGAVAAYGVEQGALLDVDAFATGAQQFLKLGLRSGRAWWVSSAHGTPDQRLEAYATGARAERAGEPAHQSCWERVGQAPPGVTMHINTYTLQLETGARVEREYAPASGYAVFRLPERQDMTGRIYAAKHPAGTTAAGLWSTWIDGWTGNRRVTLGTDSLDPFVAILDGGGNVEQSFSSLFFSEASTGNTARAATYTDTTFNTSGIVCVVVSKQGHAFIFDASISSQGKVLSQVDLNSVKTAFFYLTTTVTTAIAQAEARP